MGQLKKYLGHGETIDGPFPICERDKINKKGLHKIRIKEFFNV